MTVIHGQRLVVFIFLLKLVGLLDTYDLSYPQWPPMFTSSEQQCGISNTQTQYIVGGTVPPIHTWPWMVAIFVRMSPQGFTFLCGGSIITQNHVLTAAHCVEGFHPSNMILRLGEYDITTDWDGYRPVNILAAEFFIHPYYHERHFDVAVIRLQETMNFGYAIKPICLPTADMVSYTFQGALPFVAGWGQQADNGPTSSDKLRHVQLEVISNQDCAARNYPSIIISQEQMCAVFKSARRGACFGDSGGPLMATMNNKWYLIGVVSGGIVCADARYPTIYTRVTAVLSWIQNNLKNSY